MTHTSSETVAATATASTSNVQGAVTTCQVRRVLCLVADDMAWLRLELSLRQILSVQVTITRAVDLSQAARQVKAAAYDVVLLGEKTVTANELASLRSGSMATSGVSVVIISDCDGTDAALRAGKLGADGFLSKSQASGPALKAAIQGALQSCRQTAPNGQVDRRSDPRYEITASAVVFPILADGGPGRELAATTFDLGLGGISVLVQEDSAQIPDLCVVGVQCADQVYRYAAVEWRHRRLQLPAIRLGGRFLRRADDPFHETRLSPRFDAESLDYRVAMSPAALREWVGRGILRSREVDRVRVCPRCESLPTFRDGCPDCGAAGAERASLIHHFACAHVAPAVAFGSESLVCPKCRVPNLVVGADFEYLEGPYSCGECPWSDTSTVLIAECLGCGNRFPEREAVEKVIYAYRFERLDPRQLLDRQTR
jgi:DNA-binding response OmpR family regulator